jgi:hypothetical protein
MSSHNLNVNANPVELASPTPLSTATMGNNIVSSSNGSSEIASAVRGHPRPGLSRTVSRVPSPAPLASAPPMGIKAGLDMVLDLADGTSYTGISFGAEGKSVSGECVFQTGENIAGSVILNALLYSFFLI